MSETVQCPGRFFLWGYTARGVVGYQRDLCRPREGWYTYILKSGPGTGKDRLLARLRQRAEGQEEGVQAMVCPADPSVLDGLWMPGRRCCVLDGTAPRRLEPRYWDVTERLLHLGQTVDSAALRACAKPVLDATDACLAAQQAQCRLLHGAAGLKQEIARLAAPCIDTDKVLCAAERLAEREMPPAGPPEREQRRFLSAVTPQGVLIFYDTLQALCPRVYVIEDDYGPVAALLLARLRLRALAAGQPVITCRCPLHPCGAPEHLLLPAAGVAFTTSNRWHKADFPVYRRIHAARFLDAEALRRHRQKISFLRRAGQEVLDQAVGQAGLALQAQREVERYVAAAVDRRGEEALLARLLEEIVCR